MVALVKNSVIQAVLAWVRPFVIMFTAAVIWIILINVDRTARGMKPVSGSYVIVLKPVGVTIRARVEELIGSILLQGLTQIR